MGVNVRLERMTLAEVQQLAHLAVTSDEGARIAGRAGDMWLRRTRPDLTPPAHGRWPLLVWYCQTERILSPDELAASLKRHRRT